MRIALFAALALLPSLILGVPVALAQAPAAPTEKAGRRWFWKVVSEAGAGTTSDQVFIERLEARLKKLEPARLAEFDRQFYELHRGSYRWDLWGACYLMMGGCGDDGFEYFRAWLMTQGQAVFEKAVRDPDSLAALPRGGELEELMHLARRLYQERTGKELPYPPAGAASVPRRPLGEDWDFEDRAENKKHLPKLSARYGR